MFSVPASIQSQATIGPTAKRHSYGGPIYRAYWAPRVLGTWGEWLFIFRELGSTGNHLRGVREQAHNFRDIGSLAKKQKKQNKEKPPFCLIF